MSRMCRYAVLLLFFIWSLLFYTSNHHFYFRPVNVLSFEDYAETLPKIVQKNSSYRLLQSDWRRRNHWAEEHERTRKSKFEEINPLQRSAMIARERLWQFQNAVLEFLIPAEINLPRGIWPIFWVLPLPTLLLFEWQRRLDIKRNRVKMLPPLSVLRPEFWGRLCGVLSVLVFFAGLIDLSGYLAGPFVWMLMTAVATLITTIAFYYYIISKRHH